MERPRKGPTPAARSAGFSFVEILVVMGIIAVLVGIGIGVYMMVAKKAPEMKTRALVQKVHASTNHFKGHFKVTPPSDLNRLGPTLNLKIQIVGRLNSVNAGIEALYQALFLPGFQASPDTSDAERGNNDDGGDKLDKAITKDGSPDLYEFKDAWENPLVYFTSGDYEAADKNPPSYLTATGEVVYPKPHRNATGGFSQPDTFQVFSMGADGKPNTPDDIKAWED